MSGRSGIGVLVAGFSRVGALKKHAPLVFSCNPLKGVIKLQILSDLELLQNIFRVLGFVVNQMIHITAFKIISN